MENRIREKALADERCQVGAVETSDGVYRVNSERCIGFGLCISTCPTEAIRMERRSPESIVAPPHTEYDWYRERARIRGIDYSKYIPD
jgi:Fe-S-cluster-containing hydrogenase component 2